MNQIGIYDNDKGQLVGEKVLQKTQREESTKQTLAMIRNTMDLSNRRNDVKLSKAVLATLMVLQAVIPRNALSTSSSPITQWLWVSSSDLFAMFQIGILSLGFLFAFSVICWMTRSSNDDSRDSGDEPESEHGILEISNAPTGNTDEIPANERAGLLGGNPAERRYDHHAIYGVICKDIRRITYLLEFVGDIAGHELVALKRELELLFADFESQGHHEASVNFLMVVHNRLLEFDPTLPWDEFATASSVDDGQPAMFRNVTAMSLQMRQALGSNVGGTSTNNMLS